MYVAHEKMTQMVLSGLEHLTFLEVGYDHIV